MAHNVIQMLDDMPILPTIIGLAVLSLMFGTAFGYVRYRWDLIERVLAKITAVVDKLMARPKEAIGKITIRQIFALVAAFGAGLLTGWLVSSF